MRRVLLELESLFELYEKSADGVINGELQVHGWSVFGEMIDMVGFGLQRVCRLLALGVETMLGRVRCYVGLFHLVGQLAHYSNQLYNQHHSLTPFNASLFPKLCRKRA